MAVVQELMAISAVALILLAIRLIPDAVRAARDAWLALSEMRNGQRDG